MKNAETYTCGLQSNMHTKQYTETLLYYCRSTLAHDIMSIMQPVIIMIVDYGESLCLNITKMHVAILGAICSYG